MQRGVKDAFLRELLQCMRTAKLGSPLSPDTTLGPLNNEAGVQSWSFRSRMLWPRVQSFFVVVTGPHNMVPDFSLSLPCWMV